MRPIWPLATLAFAVGCTPQATSIAVGVDGPPLASLSLSVALSGRSPVSRTVPTSTGPLQLPYTVVLIVPDVSQPVTVSLDATDVAGNALAAQSAVDSLPHHRVQLPLRLLGGGDVGDLAGSPVLADLAQGPPRDLTGVALDMAPPPPDLAPVVIGRDTFTRPNQGGWGKASDGQTWQPGANAGNLSIAGNAGVVVNTGEAVLGMVVADAEVLVSQSFSAVLSGFDPGPVLRWQDGSNFYKAEINASSQELWLVKHVNGAESFVGPRVAFATTTNTRYWIRFRAQGTSLSAKAWPDGQPEPSGWMTTSSDASFASGHCGLRAATASDGSTSSFYSFLAVAL